MWQFRGDSKGRVMNVSFCVQIFQVGDLLLTYLRPMIRCTLSLTRFPDSSGPVLNHLAAYHLHLHAGHLFEVEGFSRFVVMWCFCPTAPFGLVGVGILSVTVLCSVGLVFDHLCANNVPVKIKLHLKRKTILLCFLCTPPPPFTFLLK